MSTTNIKQPGESRMYTMDFTPLLARDGESLVSAVVAAEPAGLTLDGTAVVSERMAQQRIAGGTAGMSYKVTFTVTTSLGNTLEGEGNLIVRDL